MKTIYTPEKPVLDKSIFLAGPTPRDASVQSWRPEALKILSELGFDGNVMVPERRDWKTNFEYNDQVEWEWEGLEGCNVIVFWIPRELETMPAFTTNVEFGSYVRSGRVVYGRPDNSPKNTYLDWLYGKVTKCKPHTSLQSLLQAAIGRLVWL